ncbi:MAG TPA: T9SS type A sorting domain-containing protein, partial [Rhodothermales bacterium]|nr:T9SS type A sorting domain-containing protein [Rhodothermales bacterium]
DFTGLTTKNNIAQIILVGVPTATSTVYVDNVYFYKTASPPPAAPTAAAPVPARRLPQNVISLFSDAYTNVPVDTWRTGWSNATFEDVTIAGNATKKYSALDFVGIETVASQINASQMQGIHFDIWSPNVTSFGVKLVDFGANGAFGGGDDVEHQVNIAAPTQGQWVSLDIPLSDFTGLTTKNNIAQIILVGVPTATSTVYVDNVYFHNNIEVATGKEELPDGMSITGNYPNPFSGSTTFKYTLSNATQVTFEVLDGLGRVIDQGKIGYQGPGEYSLPYENDQLSSGVYFLRLKTDTKHLVKKFMILN